LLFEMAIADNDAVEITVTRGTAIVSRDEAV
jgi:hypothetical protein